MGICIYMVQRRTQENVFYVTASLSLHLELLKIQLRRLFRDWSPFLFGFVHPYPPRKKFGSLTFHYYTPLISGPPTVVPSLVASWYTATVLEFSIFTAPNLLGLAAALQFASHNSLLCGSCHRGPTLVFSYVPCFSEDAGYD